MAIFFLLTYGSHDMRHTGFLHVDGGQRDPWETGHHSIHEGEELINGDNGVIKYIGGRIVLRLISICRMMNLDQEYVEH